MVGEKLCLKVEHIPCHGEHDEVCNQCGGKIMRFIPDPQEDSLDDLMDAASEPRELMIVRTRAGFNMWLEDAGTDGQGRQLWVQIRVGLGDPQWRDRE